ncbi:adaptin N terminal region-domain-containing protein [Boletus reticuloceps]|uniref:Adaptin N terminal region-domain-containing protein n=1 Tax=Boletus reticuloceps TaxID=495285 RepID=A0A8I2YNC9_9AGAM|nr:adaptin N terminal region-domain-containing protein [Boletus reticuloceps]
MDNVNLNAFTENAARLGMRIQETFSEHTRDLSITRGGASIFDMPDDKVKNIGKQLDSNSDREKLDAMKRLIALISKGRNVSNYFPQVVKNVASQNLEIRKLVYIYLLRYAEHEPDLALLSINTFQKDLADSSPLIRAMALRVLSGIKVPMICGLVVLAIKKCAADLSPYVRKAAALAIPKAFQLDAGQQPALISVITTLLRDRSPLSIGSAVVAFESVCPTRLDLLHLQYRRLCKILIDVDEWGQVYLLNLLLRYARTMLPKPTVSQQGESTEEEVDADLHLLLVSSEPLVQSKNPAVVLAVVRVFYYAGPPSSTSKVVNPLLRIMHVSREVERVVLAYLLIITRAQPQLFSMQYQRFLVRTDDPSQAKRDKIRVMLNLCDVDNHQALLREFIDCADDVDDTVVGDAVHAVGRCARVIPSCTPQCLSALMTMIKSRHGMSLIRRILPSTKQMSDIVVSNAVLVLKALIQNQLLVDSSAPVSSQSPLSIIFHLARRVDDIKHPQARACVLWLVGQYSAAPGASTVIEGVADWAPDVLRKISKSFNTEVWTTVPRHLSVRHTFYQGSLVKLQALTLAAKLFLLCPTDQRLGLLCGYVLSLGRYDLNYDVRDRTRMLNSLLVGISPTMNGREMEEQSSVILRREQVIKVLFDGKAGIIEESEETFGLHHIPIGSLSIVTGKATLGDSVLPEWLEGGIDPLLRQSEEDVFPVALPPQAISSASSTAAKTLGSAGVTPIVLTPTGSSTPVREAKESHRDLDKFYASGSDKKSSDSESSSEEVSEDNLEEEDNAHDSEESQDDTADDESSEEQEQEVTGGSSTKVQQ